MKLQLDLPKSILCLSILIILLFHASSSRAQEAQCPDVWDRGHLNVLTINLAFFEIARRDGRLERLAEFASTKALAGDPIDIFLIQEGAAGGLLGTNSSPRDLRDKLQERGLAYNSPRDLRDKLQERGLAYNLSTAFGAGIPGVLTIANAVLSRCEIDFKISKLLPATFEQIEIGGIGGLAIPITRNVMMVRLKIPDAPRHFRKINVYNTHLCAGSNGSLVVEGINVSASGCSVAERKSQLVSVLKFVKTIEQVFSFFDGKPHILGGDFNIDNFRGGEPGQFGTEKPLYDIITDAGFIDAYAKSQMDNGIPLEHLCVRSGIPFEPFPDDYPGIFQEWEPDAHCTTGVSYLNLNDGLFAEFFDRTPRRIDYIFENGFSIESGEVIFNPNASPPKPFEPIISDHAGVLVKILLQ